MGSRGRGKSKRNNNTSAAALPPDQIIDGGKTKRNNDRSAALPPDLIIDGGKIKRNNDRSAAIPPDLITDGGKTKRNNDGSAALPPDLFIETKKGGRRRRKTKCNNNRSAALPPDQKKSQEDASRHGESSSAPTKLLLKSIVFNLFSFTDSMDHWFMVGHDELSGDRPFLSELFVLPRLYRIPAAAGVFGSRLYFFPCHPGSYDNILYLDLKKQKSEEEEEDCWLDSGLKLPTLCNCFQPGMFSDWLYLIGFNIHCSDPHRKYGCDVSRDKSVWGHVYNIKDGSQYSVGPPSSSPYDDPTPPDPVVLGPWNDEGLLVYIKQDNTLRLHNPKKDEWRTLACDATRENNPCLKQSNLYLCGDVLYRYNYYSMVVEAYDIRKNKCLRLVKFDPEKDFSFPQLHFPHLCVLAHGVLCFFKFFGGHFYYRSFVVDFDCVDKPKPLSSDVLLCDWGFMQHNFEVEANVLPNLKPYSPPK